MRIATSGASPLLAMTVEGCRVENIGHSEGIAETPNGVSALLDFRRRRGSTCVQV